MTRRDLEHSIQGERRQSQKGMRRMTPYVGNVRNRPTWTEGISVVARGWGRSEGREVGHESKGFFLR